MKDSFNVHFSCVFLLFFCFVVVMFDLVHDVETVFLFLSIDAESIKFRSSSQVWWVAKF